MPSKNIIKNYSPYNYYHIYNRGVNKEPIFRDDDDKLYLLNLIANRTSSYVLEVNKQQNRHRKNLLEESEILSFCLMDNHYHFLFWLDKNPICIKNFMQNVFTSYSVHFNKKYDRVGPLFQSRYKASHVNNDPYLSHISRYIHLNPSNYEEYKFSSYKDYLGQAQFPFVKPNRILELFEYSEYEDFVKEGLIHKDRFDLY